MDVGGRIAGSSFEREKILFVDPDTASYILISYALAGYALEIIHARAGVQAIRILKENPGIAAVITEMRGPGLDGFELLKAIREIHPGICMIAQTASVYFDMENRCLDAGFNEYIAKPVDLDTLVEMVKSHVL